MKETILKLRSEGKTYNEIKNLIGCSKSTIAYHCGNGQKEMAKKRVRKRRENIIIQKVENFKYKIEKENIVEDELKNKNEKSFIESVRKFQKRDNSVKGTINKEINTTFTWEDVLNKFGENTHCYLSGEKINLFENNYNMDHIVPTSRGGLNTFDNLGILHKKVNYMKGDLTPTELIDWCKKILEYNGFEINIKK
jgi:CRISPR/Cas system Type II protein with McrA/HNH and RuvC-like nuclease domain